MERGLNGFLVQARARRGVGGLRGEQVVERLVEPVAGDLLVGDVDVAEDGLVQAAADLVGGVLVELVGVLEQGEAGFEEECAFAEVELDAAELLGDALAFLVELEQSCLDLRVRDVGVGEQVEEVLLVHVDVVELLLQLRVQDALCLFLAADGLGDEGAHGGDELWAKALLLVELVDRVLDPDDVVVRLLAVVVTPAGAEEVEVLAAVASFGALDDEAPVETEPVVALAAEYGALEVVVVFAASFAGATAGLRDLLYLHEELLVDEGFVLAGEVLAFVADEPDVVGVAEHLVHLVDGHRPGGMLRGRPGGEAAGGELVDDVVERVLAGRVELERELHERGALGVDLDAADVAAFTDVADV